jgi:hypothetical protein
MNKLAQDELVLFHRRLRDLFNCAKLFSLTMFIADRNMANHCDQHGQDSRTIKSL